MKSSAPWSVKGIERDARDTAKEAAKRQGMTVGEWLNKVIYTAGETPSSEGDVEGLKLRDLVTAIEHLHKRLAEADVKGADAIGELQRQFGGVVERVQLLERVKPAEGTYDDLAARLKKVEEKGGDRQRVEALRALEKAVGQVAVQFDNAHKTSIQRLDAAEQQVQSLGEKIDNLGGDSVPANTGALQNAVEELTERVTRAETIADEASKLKDAAMAAGDPDFVERTGERLRVLGDEIKRGGDQIRTLETALNKISDQIEAAEKRSADGVQKVTETIAELRNSFSSDGVENAENAAIVEIAVTAARQTTEAQISTLQSAVQDVANRLESFDSANKAASQSEDEFKVEPSEDPVSSDADESMPLAFDVENHEEPENSAAKDESALSPSSAWSNDDASDDDDDAFSISENDFASLTGEPKDTATTGQAADDFAFDLDDDDADSFNADKDASDASDDPISEIEESSSSLFDGSSASGRDALDDILADLDPTSTSPASDDNDTITDDGESQSAMALAAQKPSQISKHLNLGDDGDEEDEQKESQPRPTRRNLTAKQKAILAARARQKRKAAEKAAGGTSASDAIITESTKPSENTIVDSKPITRDAYDEDEEQSGNVAISALNWVKSRFSRKDDDDDQDRNEYASDRAESDDELRSSEQHAESSTLAGLKTSTSVRPVTLALGVAIILALSALFFLVRDIVFKPDAALSTPTAAQQQPASTANASDAAASPNASTVETATPDSNVANDGNVINPRALYLDSIAALNAAESPDAASAAIERLEEAAALGHPPAQLQLGELYKTGQGVEEDLSQARIWFRRSANGGNVLAMHRIGVLTARGDGGPADTQAAISWFERAANRGLVDSQYNLGAIYHPTEDGGAAIQDAGKAYYWYSLASRNGDTQAGPLAVGVASALTTAERQEIERRVAAWRAEEPDAAANEVSTTG